MEKRKKAGLLKTLAMTGLGAIAAGANQPVQAQVTPTEEQPAKQVQEVPAGIIASTDMMSKYIFAGIPFSESPVIWSSATAYKGGLSITGFANYDMKKGDFNEADVFLTYSENITDELNFSATYGYFNFDLGEGWQNTHEVSGKITLESLLTPAITVGHDFNLGDGNLIQASLSHGINYDGISVNLEGILTHNDEYYVKTSGFTHTEIGASSTLTLGKGFTITPTIKYLISFDRELIENQLYGGVSLSLIK